MATFDKMILTYDPSGSNYQYIIKPINNVPDDLNKPNISVTPAGSSYKDNIQYGVSGQENKITINFAIHNDGTDKSNGTAEANGLTGFTQKDIDSDGTDETAIVTIADQFRYIKNYLQAPPVTSNWVLTDTKGIYGDISDPTTGLGVNFTNFRGQSYNKNSPKWRNVRFELEAGDTQ